MGEDKQFRKIHKKLLAILIWDGLIGQWIMSFSEWREEGLYAIISVCL